MEEEVCSEAEGAVVVDSVDHSGGAAIRSRTGSWKSAWFIISVEVAERCAYYGIQTNLISYLTGPLHQSTATAAQNVNVWSGTSALLPLFGAFLADSYFGRYRTIIIASSIYILVLFFLFSLIFQLCQIAIKPFVFYILAYYFWQGLGLLTLSAMLAYPTNAHLQEQQILFFVSLYLVAIGQGGHKPCVQAFGADQFDPRHPKEYKDRSSFFNWWYFTMCAGCVATLWILNYVQDNISWILGFGIPCLAMIIALLIFLLGTTTYRFNIHHSNTPFLRIGRVFLAAIRNRPSNLHQSSGQFSFLDKALLGSEEEGSYCSLNEVEEAKAMLRLGPIWATCLVYTIAFAQVPTFFTKQGVNMDRTIFPGFDIPPASLHTLSFLGIVLFSPIYDRIFVPVARSITGKHSGITMLQRIGTGILMCIFNLVLAAVVESKRLKVAQEYGFVDDPNATIPMSVWWLFPQYFMFGISNVFTMVGMQEFFYDQVPNELRSMGLALYLSTVGVGSFLSSFLISVIQQVTGKDGWIANNLNRAHIDYFYLLIAGLGVIGLALFILFTRSYIYKVP